MTNSDRMVNRFFGSVCVAMLCLTAIDPVAADSPAHPFQLLVVGADRKPLANAEVELRGSPLATAEQITRGKFVRKHSYGIIVRSDVEGTLGVNLPANLNHFNVSISIPGYAPYWAGWSSGENSEAIPPEFTAELDAAWSVGGIILDETGKPVEGVSVHPSIRFKKRPGDEQELGVGTTVKTDAEGKWRYDCVPVSKESVHVEINHSSFRPLRQSLSKAEFSLGLDQPPFAEIVLDRGLSIVGKVTDTEGQPIAGATIRTKLINDIREAKTDEMGTYRLSGLESAKARIVVFAKGKATDMREVRIEPEMEPVDFAMSPGGTVRVRVLDAQDRPVPKARIFFQRWRGRIDYFEFNHVSQYADKDGVWIWNEAPLDAFQADICPPEGMQLGEQFLIARDEEFVFRTPPALVITGKVLDAETQQPIKSFVAIPGVRSRDDITNWVRREQFTATDGQYRLRHRHDYTHLVRIEAEGYQPAVSRVIKSDEGNVTIDFALRKGKDLAATVLTPAGKPAERARVALGIAGSQITVKNGEIDFGNTYCAKRESNEMGRFQFPYEESDFQIVITHPEGYAHIEATTETFPGIIKLDPWAKVEGTFRVGREPAARVKLRLTPTALQSYGSKVPRIYTDHEGATDQHGRFMFDRVVPGPARIGREILLMVNEGAKEIASSSSVPIDLSAEKTTHLELGGKGRTVVAQLQPPASFKEKVDWAFAIVNVEPAFPDLPMPDAPPIPQEIQNEFVKREQWMLKWQQTPAGQAWTAWRAAIQEQQRQRETNPHHWATVNREGVVRFADILAGDYRLSVRFNEKPAGVLIGYRFTIPEMEGGRSDEPLDLGELTLK